MPAAAASAASAAHCARAELAMLPSTQSLPEVAVHTAKPQKRYTFFFFGAKEKTFSMAESVRALVDQDFAWLCKDNPEYASQAGHHEHDAALQVRRSVKLSMKTRGNAC